MHILPLLLIALGTSLASADESLWEKLKHEPNMVVLMRNAESGGNRDGANMLVWDASGKCQGESVLTEEGKARARRVAAAFAQHGISPTVISSPMCRCTETAGIAFGEYTVVADLRQRPPGDADGEALFQSAASSLLARYRGSAPIVFVNHRPNINLLTMELIAMDELLVGTVFEDGEVEVVGRILLE